MMELDSQLTLVVVVTILAVVSPGPDFAVTTRNALMFGRRSGVATALGIASGISVHVGYTLLGLGYLMAESIWLLELMRYAGAAYLIYLGISAFKPLRLGTKLPLQDYKVMAMSDGKAFWNGFLSNALNPKTALFFIALFTQVVSPETSSQTLVGLGVLISLVHFIWFVLVALLLTNKYSKALFERSKLWIERFVGTCLIGLGLQLAFSK